MSAEAKIHWPHAPTHWLYEPGLYIVTAGTCGKELFFAEDCRKDMLLRALFACAEEKNWHLEAWAVLSNHYHFVARSPGQPASLRAMLGKLHMLSAKAVNQMDNAPGRKVWFQYWDSLITYERSYLARLQYVHQNPVHHRVVDKAEDYPWCSAAWFACHAPTAFVKTVQGFKMDKVNVYDEF